MNIGTLNKKLKPGQVVQIGEGSTKVRLCLIKTDGKNATLSFVADKGVKIANYEGHIHG